MKIREGMVVHCDTNDKSDKFLHECVRQGITSRNGNLATKLSEMETWYKHMKDTCYRMGDGFIEGFCDKEYYTEKGYQITTFDDLFKSKNKEHKTYKMPDYVHKNVLKVIISNPCVVVFLNDGTKGLARCHEEDIFDEELGYDIAYRRAIIKQMKMKLMTEEYLLQRLCR